MGVRLFRQREPHERRSVLDQRTDLLNRIMVNSQISSFIFTTERFEILQKVLRVQKTTPNNY